VLARLLSRVCSSLSGNPLSGELPGALAGAAALRVLALSGTDVGGVLPAELATLAHLHTLCVCAPPRAWFERSRRAAPPDRCV